MAPDQDWNVPGAPVDWNNPGPAEDWNIPDITLLQPTEGRTWDVAKITRIWRIAVSSVVSRVWSVPVQSTRTWAMARYSRTWSPPAPSSRTWLVDTVET